MSIPRSAMRPIPAPTAPTRPMPNAATVIMFGRPGIPGRGVPGVFANYSRKGA